MTTRRFSVLLSVAVVVATFLVTARVAVGLTAEVRAISGSPTLCVDGKPTAPLMFFGWAVGGRPYTFVLDTEWKTYGFTFTAPERNDGHFGAHIRFGGSGPGTVWIDDVRLVEGDRDHPSAANMLKHGGWEGTKEEVGRVWHLFTDKESYGSEAEWETVTDDKTEGERACRLIIRAGGSSTMHCHFYQSGVSCKRGQLGRRDQRGRILLVTHRYQGRHQARHLSSAENGPRSVRRPPCGHEHSKFRSANDRRRDASVHANSSLRCALMRSIAPAWERLRNNFPVLPRIV